jgi:hypothetical protein
MNNNIIMSLTIKQLLSESRYLIPIYQRNYDWGEKEALQLIEDVADYASYKKDCNYYIGSLIVFIRYKEGNEYCETIDGQQRLTTLNILMSLLRSFDEVQDKMKWYEKANLSYDHRKEANEALRLLSENKLYDHPYVSSISEVYNVMKKNIKNILSEKSLSLSNFVDYLISKVIIIRIPVPKDTELNHYFEIMNSRGEQLEKHEVLKASLMDNLDKCDFILFNAIWEACSDMSTYVQMKMNTNLRSLLFTDSWSNLQTFKFDELNSKYYSTDDESKEDSTNDEYVPHSISELFNDASNNVTYELPSTDRDVDKGTDRFGTIINFPNFLLHVLKVMYHSETSYKKEINEEIKLDDKRLIEIFSIVLADYQDKKGFVKRFIMDLLKIRVLFDNYVIKREYYNGKEGWSLKRLRRYDGSKTNYIGSFSNDDNEDDMGKNIRMLEAMFHVSAPTQIYKHWLNAVLKFLFTEENINSFKLRTYLFKLSCTYMLDRYLCDNRIDFETIIYENECKAVNKRINWEAIDRGCDVENFIFNFYDYLVWQDNLQKYNKFEFSYRTSVEHFYPQTALPGYAQLTKETGLHDFGNLCLISRSMNSKFSNNMPNAKCDNFGNDETVKDLSLKLVQMMDVVRDKNEWCTLEIKEFEERAKNIILNGIKTAGVI